MQVRWTPGRSFSVVLGRSTANCIDTNNKIPTVMNKLLVLGVTMLALHSGPAAGSEYIWSSPCSSGGIIDESSTGLYQVFGSQLWHKTGATGDVVARYDVVPPPGIGMLKGIFMVLGYLDTGPNGSVTATLWEVDRCTGSASSLCSVESEDSPTADCVFCLAGEPDFINNLYFVNVTVSRRTTTAIVRANTIALSL
jgi:hypothetical protein